jgi:hypothetical protein
MRVPANAVIAEAKLRGYLLTRREADDKSLCFWRRLDSRPQIGGCWKPQFARLPPKCRLPKMDQMFTARFGESKVCFKVRCGLWPWL